jgi:4-azaleucine resistance transporter AzlC
MGYVPLGAIFGVLLVQAGGPWWLALLVSVWVYAGSAQYALVPMLAAGLGAWSVAMAVALINLRHVFYGLSLLEHQPKQPWARAYLMFALTDETYSVVTTWPHADCVAGHVASRLVGVGHPLGLWFGYAHSYRLART